MIPVAFFAPLKAPTHPTPSGDRELGRALLNALAFGGFAPDLASEMRCLDMQGNAAAQAKLVGEAAELLPALVDQGRARGWRCWISYHNYYKAPDLLGPAVSNALGIPYVQIESTRARKRLGGPWDRFAQIAETAADAADVIFHFTLRDREALEAYGPKNQSLVHLHPFLDRETLPPQSDRSGPMLSVAMMRPGDKLESYKLVAQAMDHLTGPWALSIVGDGKARPEIEGLMARFGDQVSFLGQMGSQDLEAVYKTASLLFWPGVNEAIGLTYLEAQAAGIPVLAQDRPGLRDVLAPGLTGPAPQDGPKALAAAIEAIRENPMPAHKLRQHISDRHLLPAAARTLTSALLPLTDRVPG